LPSAKRLHARLSVSQQPCVIHQSDWLWYQSIHIHKHCSKHWKRTFRMFSRHN